MSPRLRALLTRYAGSVRQWQLWNLRPLILTFVLLVMAADLAAIAVSVPQATVTRHDILLFAVLLACDLATAELTRRAGEPSGLALAAHAVWELPVALLLPPLYGLMAPIVRIAFAQCRIRQPLGYRRCFTMAVLGISYAGSSVAFHALNHEVTRVPGLAPVRILTWALVACACGVLRAGINKLLMMTAVKGSNPSAWSWSSVLSREVLFGDVAELSVGVLIAYAALGNVFLIPLALPIVTLLQRSQRHTQLVSQTRIDGKTGLLNATTWQREAEISFARASRSRGEARLAVLLADIDFFKSVNDTYGHQTGDVVLTAIATAMSGQLREYDLCGRWGGEEFSILLADTTPEEAEEIAQRLRVAVSELDFPQARGAAGPDALRVTISVGVAALAEHADLDELIAAADHALYVAKADGGNRVRVSEPDPGRQARQ